ncbi:MAG: DUF4197 family protein [Gammaproteobacteria bacterium]|nr:DUF4197 family protein [Gammaproteobacteria bacterium]
MHKPPVLILALMISGSLLLAGCQELAQSVEKVRPVIEQVETAIQQAEVEEETISSQQMIAAIKQALDQGVDDAVNLLGAAQGFQSSARYRIAMPEQLQQPAELLRQFGLGSKVDLFQARLNDAATAAVKQASPVFVAAIEQMSVKDALAILQGADNAATLYFRRNTEQQLRQQFAPVIQRATEQNRVVQAYKSLNSSIQLVSPSSEYTVDIDQYVMDQALAALFDRIAREEKLIREQPVKRTTELMQKVFGKFGNS